MSTEPLLLVFDAEASLLDLIQQQSIPLIVCSTRASAQANALQRGATFVRKSSDFHNLIDAVRAVLAGNDIVLHSPDDAAAFAGIKAAIESGKIPDAKTQIGFLTWKRFHAGK